MAMLEYDENEAREAWKEYYKEYYKEEGMTTAAANMLKENISIEIIARVTNLPENKILSLR
ncbi:MAG: monoheme cytochrome c [Selenomonadaceae bacterium]|nr:monoheme cytochrome c [Selenomonadaceae bacterium]